MLNKKIIILFLVACLADTVFGYTEKKIFCDKCKKELNPNYINKEFNIIKLTPPYFGEGKGYDPTMKLTPPFFEGYYPVTYEGYYPVTNFNKYYKNEY